MKRIMSPALMRHSVNGFGGRRFGLQLVRAACFLALCAANPAIAADIELTSKIQAVTVFPNGAQISRTAEAEVRSGANAIVFKGLPTSLDVNSLRVKATGAAGLVIGSVEARVAPAQQTPRSPLAEKLRDLTNERNLLVQKSAALQAKKQMIQRYAKASPEKLGEKAEPMKVGDWDKAWNAVGGGLAKVAEELQAVQMRQREVARAIQVLRRSNRGKPSGSQARRIVSVAVDAAQSGKVQLILTYRVGGASWRPVYDARLETAGTNGKPALELIRRASVRQHTGEDWNGVVLSVSTVRANRGTQAPDLLAQRLEFYNPAPQRPRPTGQPMAMKDRAGSRALQRRYAPVRNKPASLVAAQEQQAVVEASAYEAQFRIPGKIELKADNSARLLRIGSSKIAPDLMVRAVPAVSANAYLEAAFVNKDEAALLPGLVNIHRDGSYVGRGRFKLVAPGDKVTLGFGSDDSVRIKRVPVSRTQSGPGWIGKNRSSVSDFKTTITNLHTFPVKVRIIDRIPISEDDKIVVTPQPGNTTATEKNVDGRRGVFAWVFNLKPKATKDIQLGWQTQWPDGKRIRPRNLPN